MEKQLTKQQLEALDRFKKLKVGALFTEMGTGKTRTAIELVNYNKPDFLLYLTPCATKENIRLELEKWGTCCPYEIVGYETIASSDKKYLELLALLDTYQKVFIIADESIFIKNGRTKRFKRSCALREKCEFALVLNGTPVVKDERDLFNQMQFLSKDILKMTYPVFLQKFFVEHCIRKHGREMVYHTFYEPNRPAFLKMIAPYSYQASLLFDKEESEKVYWVEDDGGYNQAKSDYYDNMSRAFMAGDIDSIIAMFGYLHHAASTNAAKNQEVADYIRGKQIICFCQYLDEVQEIASYCPCYIITGDTKADDRDCILKDFRNDTKPLLLTFGVGAYSLNLQFCHEIVYSSLTFNYGSYEQSKFRIKRMGQESDIRYTYILLNVGINDMVLKNVGAKEGLAEAVKKELRKDGGKELLKKL